MDQPSLFNQIPPQGIDIKSLRIRDLSSYRASSKGKSLEGDQRELCLSVEGLANEWNIQKFLSTTSSKQQNALSLSTMSETRQINSYLQQSYVLVEEIPELLEPKEDGKKHLKSQFKSLETLKKNTFSRYMIPETKSPKPTVKKQQINPPINFYLQKHLSSTNPNNSQRSGNANKPQFKSSIMYNSQKRARNIVAQVVDTSSYVTQKRAQVQKKSIQFLKLMKNKEQDNKDTSTLLKKNQKINITRGNVLMQEDIIQLLKRAKQKTTQFMEQQGDHSKADDVGRYFNLILNLMK